MKMKTYTGTEVDLTKPDPDVVFDIRNSKDTDGIFDRRDVINQLTDDDA